MSISTVTSEALQLKLRQLLPSQQGFGTDLSASNTIIPIIDLTEAAEGSDVGQLLQTAFGFGGITSHSVYNTTTTLQNTPGFYRIYGSFGFDAAAGTINGSIILNDGSTNKAIYGLGQFTAGNGNVLVDVVCFLRAGDLVKITTGAGAQFIGCSRQIADANGTLVQPIGFTPS